MMEFNNKTQNTQEADINTIGLILTHIDHLIAQFRMRVIDGGAVQSRVIHSHWKVLSTLREQDNNLWVKTMLSYFLRLKTYYEHYYNFVDNATINLISSNYKSILMGPEKPTIQDFERVLFEQISLFCKNTRKLEI